MNCNPPKPPRPCACGCPEMIAQKQRGGAPKRFASDMCQRRAAEREAGETREHDALRKRLVRAGEVEQTPRPARTPDEQEENERQKDAAYYRENKARLLAQRRRHTAEHPKANAEACRRWREKRRQKQARQAESV